MVSNQDIQNARRLFAELKSILGSEGETNWIRGIGSALSALQGPDPHRSYTEARSIYKTMLEGKGGFSDYYIQRADFVDQKEANRRLDEVRDELWKLFQGE